MIYRGLEDTGLRELMENEYKLMEEMVALRNDEIMNRMKYVFCVMFL